MWEKISNHISETQGISFQTLKVYPKGKSKEEKA